MFAFGCNYVNYPVFCPSLKEGTQKSEFCSVLKNCCFPLYLWLDAVSRKNLRDLTQWNIATLGVLRLRKMNLLMVRAMFLSFSQALPQEKYINKISMVTLARSGVKTTECKLILFLFLSFPFGWLLLCCSIFKWFYRAHTAGDFRVAPLLLFLNNSSALAQYYHADDSLLWYRRCSRTIPHKPSLS